jgi:hypothetical protein
MPTRLSLCDVMLDITFGLRGKATNVITIIV